MNNCRKEAETLFGDDVIFKKISKATNGQPERAKCASKMTNGVVDTWAFSVPLPSDPDYSICVDSTGYLSDILGSLKGYSCLD